MNARQFKKDEVIFREGAFGSTMYEIKSGTVGIYAAYGTDSEKKLTELEAGRIFGEMALIEVYPRSATAVALSDTETMEISTADLSDYFNNHPEKLVEIMRGMTRRLRELTEDYQNACGAISNWTDAVDHGQKKSGGLLNGIKKLAAIFSSHTEHMPEVNYSSR
ncbi:MAG: Crp/Fnr family transcriptional regulator [Ruminococcaceae bacterium]|jgi:CRP-like cAMP-binding protein|nr:Crp/Fnr family transcriptional regulator [Oscillospiraceae bacterium]